MVANRPHPPSRPCSCPCHASAGVIAPHVLVFLNEVVDAVRHVGGAHIRHESASSVARLAGACHRSIGAVAGSHSSGDEIGFAGKGEAGVRQPIAHAADAMRETQSPLVVWKFGWAGGIARVCIASQNWCTLGSARWLKPSPPRALATNQTARLCPPRGAHGGESVALLHPKSFFLLLLRALPASEETSW